MNFKTADKVRETICAGDIVERRRSNNRAKIHAMFNGAPSLSPQDASKMGLRVNFNTNEAAVLGQHGRRQYANAFTSRQRYFRVSLPDAPESKAAAWGAVITNKINRTMKQSRLYYEMHRSQWASVLLDGIAPKVNVNPYCWRPKFMALRDFRVPTDTECSLEDLGWYAVRHRYTYFSLANAALGKNSPPGWNKEAIQKLLDRYKNENTQTDNDLNWATQPETFIDRLKQNGGWYSSDALPRIPIWEFMYRDDDGKWSKCAVPDSNSGTPETAGAVDFLFKSPKYEAEQLSHLLHIQFGDLNSSPPFLYHSVRSLGFLLMEPCYWSNVLTCRLIQHCMDNMNAWLRGVDPVGRGKAQIVELMNRGWLPEGVSVVPQTERHQINTDILDITQERMKAIIQEASVAYTQDTQGRSSPDETATAVMARVSSVNALMSGLLSTAFSYEQFSYNEICRRFCIENSPDRDVQAFQEACLAAGVPKAWLDVGRWDIDPEIPLGNGNPTMEMMQSQALFEMRGSLPPEAQQEVVHERIIALTGDPRKADRMAPLGDQMPVTEAQRFAEIAFGVLMQGVPIQPQPNLNPTDQANTLLGLLAGVIARIEATGGMATSGEMAGIDQVAKFLQNPDPNTYSLIPQIAQDPQLIPVAKDLSDKLGKLMNTVKAFAQRAQEQSKAQANGNGAAEAAQLQAKLASMQIAAEAKAKTTEAKTAQSMQHKEVSHILQEKRLDESTAAEITRKNALALAEAANRPPAAE